VPTSSSARGTGFGAPVPLLEGRFGEAVSEVRAAMERLAGSLPPAELARRAFRLYEQFRPAVPSGEAGWGKAGVLDLAKLLPPS
jgi:hypothetical protein